MKKVLLIVALAIPYYLGFSQDINIPIDSTTGLAQYSRVIRIEGASKDELYSKAKEWFARTFRSADAVLQMDDRVVGKLVGRANTTGVTYRSSGFTHDGGYFSYTVAIYIKEGRLKYVIDDIYYTDNGKLPSSWRTGDDLAVEYPDWGNALKKGKLKMWQDFQRRTHSELMLIVASLELSMLDSSTEEGDW